MEAVAKLRNCPMSPRKMRLVVDLIRGKNVNDALNILKFTKKEASIWLEKLLLSAINNWEQKHGEGGAEAAKLYVKTALTWEFLTDLSGAIGFTGKTPQFSIGNVTTSDAGTAAVVTVNDDGVDASGNPKYKINFSIPKGGKGDKGDKGDVEYATFYLDHITGCLYMTYDPSFNNVSFSIKNGNLILEINTL